MFYKLRRAGEDARAHRRRRLRHHRRPRPARRAAHRQGLRGGAPATSSDRPRLRRRRRSTPRRPAGSPGSSASRTDVAGLAKVGPIHNQAESITRLFRSPRTAVHLVTLLEEMPVQETVDAVDELPAAELPVGGVIINVVRPPLLPAWPTLAAAREGELDPAAIARRAWRRAGVDDAETVAEALLDEARDARRAGRRSSSRGRRTLDGSDRPTFELPLLEGGVDVGGLVRAGRRAAASAGGGMTAPPATAPTLDVDALLADRGYPHRSCAAAAAASARRRPPPRSRCAPPSRAARSSCSPSTRRAGWPSRWASTELDNTPRAGGRRRHARPAASSTR